MGAGWSQRAQITRQTWGHTGSTVHTERTDNQSNRSPLRHCLLYIQRVLATSLGEGRLGTEGTDNQRDRGYTQWKHWGTFGGHR